jgi:hypothetical protein
MAYSARMWASAWGRPARGGAGLEVEEFAAHVRPAGKLGDACCEQRFVARVVINHEFALGVFEEVGRILILFPNKNVGNKVSATCKTPAIRRFASTSSEYLFDRLTHQGAGPQLREVINMVGKHHFGAQQGLVN